MIKAFGLTDPGQQRSRNEDTLFINEETQLFLVADGMGGHRSGELASARTATIIDEFVSRTRLVAEITWPFGYQTSVSVNANRLVNALKLANRAIWKQADADLSHYGMGTTVVCLLVDENLATFGSAGDSRLYLLREGTVQQLTQDDSWLAAVPAGESTSSHLRHVLTKAVGAQETLDVTAQELVLQPSDYLLLSSDGLHSIVPEQEIAAIILTDGEGLEAKVNRLIQRANELGGPDNITAMLLQFCGTD